MRTGRIVTHGIVLAAVTIGSISVGFAVYRLLGLFNQIAVQVLVAGVVCVAAFALWGLLSHRGSGGRLSIADLKELGTVYATALVWTPVLFVPLHYVTQGYLTSFGNILGIWLFQLPFGLLSLMVANGRLVLDGRE